MTAAPAPLRQDDGAPAAQTLFAGLLDPIPGERICGEALRYGPVHAAIEEARRQDDANLPRGVWEHDLKRADWPEVIRLSQAALAGQSKDLQVAGWLIDAAVHVHGVPAVAPGLAFLSALCDAFWEGLYPAHDGEPDSPRFSPLVWLDKAVGMGLRRYPVLVAPPPPGEDDGFSTVTWSWADYESARRAEGERTLDDFHAAAERVAADRILRLNDALYTAKTNTFSFEAGLRDLAGEDAPGLSGIRQALDEIGRLIAPIHARIKDALPPPPPDPLQEAAMPEPPNPDLAPNVPVAKLGDLPAPKDREEAYKALATIAATLRRLEPHSPTPYLIERAVQWGGMGLAEVMDDIARGGHDPGILAWLLSGPNRP